MRRGLRRALSSFALNFLVIGSAFGSLVLFYQAARLEGRVYLATCTSVIVLICVWLVWRELKAGREDRQERTIQRIDTSIRRIQTRVGEYSRASDYYKLILADWRLATEASKFDDLHRGLWTLFAHETYDYFLYVFTQIVNGLRDEDEYVTLSKLEFWLKDRDDEDLKARLARSLEGSGAAAHSAEKTAPTSFLTANIRAHLRGVRIRRIIVVDSNLFGASTVAEEGLEDLCRLVTHFDKVSRQFPHSKLLTQFYVSDDYKKDCGADAPYALISCHSQKSYMLLRTDMPADSEDYPPNPRFASLKAKITQSTNACGGSTTGFLNQPIRSLTMPNSETE